MRVLHLHHGDNARWGGGIIAMLRLHAALRAAGVESSILCGVKSRHADDSEQMPRRHLLEAVLARVARPLGFNDLHAVSSFDVVHHPRYRASDVVHVQGLHGGFFNYLALPALTREKPVVYTLHDMWAMTGHCAYSYDCERWRRGCGACPHLDAPPAVTRDVTRWEWWLKDRSYRRAALTFVAVSRWIADLAQQSMLGRFPIHVIPNAVDTGVYRPLDREQCRALLGIPRRRKVVLWLTTRLDVTHPEGYRKGADLFLAALDHLPRSIAGDVLLLVAGGNTEAIGNPGVPMVDLGFVGSDPMKAIAYSAADVFVHPTRADNAPLTLIESMACGTPAVSFDVGGVPELVRPGVTGMLAEPGDARSLAEQLTALLMDDRQREAMSARCRLTAVTEYALEDHVKRHVDLYHQLHRAG